MAADVVNLADAAVVNDKVDGAAVVLHVQPVADVLAITVDRQRLVVQHVRNHERNQLFREMIRAVVVRAARDCHRHTKRAVVRLHEQVSTCLARRVRAGGVNRCFLGEKQVGTVKRQIAVNLVGRNLMIALNAILTACVEQHLRAHDVGLQENGRVLNRAVNMALRCKVYDNLRLLLLKNAVNRFAVSNIRLDKLEMRIVHHRRKRLHVTCIGQRVHTQNIVLRVLFEHKMHKVAANKSGTAGY